jgi:TolB protein
VRKSPPRDAHEVFTALAAALFAALTLLLVSSQASATAPGENGRIAFRRYFNPEHTWGAIFTLKPNGSGLRRVTHPRHEILHTEPDWSANGRWITYHRLWHGEKIRADHPRQIFKIHPNGKGRKNLTKVTCRPDACLGDFLPSWSPNGRHIAFIRIFGPNGPAAEGAVVIMRANGTHPRRVTHAGSRNEDANPIWSPHGHRLVFFRFDEKREKDAVFVIRTDGTHEQRITPWKRGCAQSVDWSPKGRWILTTCLRNGQSDLWLVHPNGANFHRLTDSAGSGVQWFSSSFSPDGTQIVTSRSPGSGAAGNADVYTINLDGTGLVNITQSVRWDSAPDWGPRH